MPAPNTTLSPLTVTVSGLSKQFPGVTALDDVSLQFRSGLITAVLGENGAGKSTLMSILAGLQAPDSGSIVIGGTQIQTFSPQALLRDHGVALVPQEIALCQDRTVAENVLLGREPGPLPSRRRMNAITGDLLAQIDTVIDPKTRVGLLTVAEQQLILIVRALARDCRVLILDEPTTSLTNQEVDRLFTLLRRLRSHGTTIVYVSHRLPEVFALCDDIHVLRDGKYVAGFATSDVTSKQLVAAMVGRDIAERTHNQRTVGPTVLEVTDLTGPQFHDVSLTVKSGEIVGVAGLPDSGRTELVAALFGASRSTGTISLDGRVLRLRTPRDAMRRGIGYVPAERRSQAIFPDMSVSGNATILDVDATARFGIVRRRKLRAIATQRMNENDVRGSINSKITGLSGGNQQKVILGRWLAREPRLLILDDPTRGVDVGAKAEIHSRIELVADSGAAVLIASSDLPELLRTCDRIVVMAQGRVAGIVDSDSASEESVMSIATRTIVETSPTQASTN